MVSLLLSFANMQSRIEKVVVFRQVWPRETS